MTQPHDTIHIGSDPDADLVERCAKAMAQAAARRNPLVAMLTPAGVDAWVRDILREEGDGYRELARACLAARDAHYDEKQSALALLIIEKGVERGYLSREEADRKKDFFLHGFKARPSDEGTGPASASASAQRVEPNKFPANAISKTVADQMNAGGRKP